MKCLKCGADNKPNAGFCIQCGQQLIPAAGQAPIQAPVVQPAPAQPPPGGASTVMMTAVGNNIIQLNLSDINGSQVNVNIQPTKEPKPRPLPVVLPPLAFPNLLDRQPELQDVAQALEQRAPVEISGEAGLGKTSLLRAIGNSPFADPKRFPSGVVYHRAFGRSEPDILQSLFELFYDLPEGYKPSPERIHLGLHNLQSLVLLDDVSLTSDQLTDLRSQAPNCTFVLVSTQRALWGEGRVLALSGLPPEESLALIERELRRPLTPQEQPAARKLCDALKGNPDQLLKVSARVSQGQTFESILKSMAQAPLNPILLSGLPNAEMRVLSVVALGRGAAVPVEHIAPLANLPDVRLSLQALQQRRLLQSHSPSYSLTGSLAQELWRDWDLTPWAERALGYFTTWAEAQRANPRRIIDSLDVILSLLDWAVSKQRWAQVQRLGRAIQAALALALRWGAWLQVLTWLLTAARALGERAAEGWALHQIGTHALCVGNRPAAHSFLTQALTLRQAIGDHAGVAVTQHNLHILLGPLAPPSQGKPPAPEGPSSTPSRLASAHKISAIKWMLPLIGVSGLVVVLAIVAIWHPWTITTPTPTTQIIPSSTPIPPVPTHTPTSTNTVTQTPTRTPMPTNTATGTQPPTYTRTRTPTNTVTSTPTHTYTPTITPTGTQTPDIWFTLDAGCNLEYQPGAWPEFKLLPNLDGWVTVSLDYQALSYVNQQWVPGGAWYYNKVQIPFLPGGHILSVIYQVGSSTIARECPFTVAQPTPTPMPTPTPTPYISMWLDPGQCGGQVATGDPVGIHVWANQDGRVDFTYHYTWDYYDTWYTIGEVSSVEVAANKEAVLGWNAPESTSRFTLKASLNYGVATAACDLEVIEKNPPSVTNVSLIPNNPCDYEMVTAEVSVWDDSGINAVRFFSRRLDDYNFSEVSGNNTGYLTYQFAFSAPKAVGSEFYIEVTDIYGNFTSTSAQANYQAYAGITEYSDGVPWYCSAFLILPRIDLNGMDYVYYPINNLNDCLTKCMEGYYVCDAFTFDSEVSGCWLKNGVPAPSPKEVCTSGIKFRVELPK